MGFFGSITNKLASWGSSAASAVGGFVTSAYNSVANAIRTANTKVIDTAKAVDTGIYNFAGDAAHGVATITKQVYGDIKSLVNRPFDILQSPLSLFAISVGVVGGTYLFTKL